MRKVQSDAERFAARVDEDGLRFAAVEVRAPDRARARFRPVHLSPRHVERDRVREPDRLELDRLAVAAVEARALDPRAAFREESREVDLRAGRRREREEQAQRRHQRGGAREQGVEPRAAHAREDPGGRTHRHGVNRAFSPPHVRTAAPADARTSPDCAAVIAVERRCREATAGWRTRAPYPKVNA